MAIITIGLMHRQGFRDANVVIQGSLHGLTLFLSSCSATANGNWTKWKIYASTATMS